MNFLYQQKSNIAYNNWIHKVRSKLPKSKKKSLYINKKYDEGYIILSYYYNLIEQTDKSLPLYTYKYVCELKSNKLYFRSLLDIYPTYYTFDIDYNILIKITKIMLDNKSSIPNVSKAIKESKNKKMKKTPTKKEPHTLTEGLIVELDPTGTRATELRQRMRPWLYPSPIDLAPVVPSPPSDDEMKLIVKNVSEQLGLDLHTLLDRVDLR